MKELTSTHIGVAGDWHGDLGWALRAIKSFKDNEIDTIVHLGDFGIWPNSPKFIRRIEKLLGELDMVLYVIPGNHEDYAQIGNIVVAEDGLQYFTNHIVLMPRGFRWVWAGKSFVALGGANSIDFEQRTLGVNWWLEESITLGDAYRTMEGGIADIMFTHEAPSGIVSTGGSNRWSFKGLAYANQSSEIMLQVVDAVQPKLFMHGHYHHYYDKVVVSDIGYNTRYIGTDKENTQYNMAVISLDTLQVDFVKK